MEMKSQAGNPATPDVLAQAQEYLSEIQTLLEKMQRLMKASDTGAMAQLVIRRGHCVDALMALPLDRLDESGRNQILAWLETIRQLGNPAESSMDGIVKDIEQQMAACRKGKQLLAEYKLNPDPERRQSTRSDHA